MIRIDEVLDAPASPDVVWEVLSDPERVVRLVSGASLDSRNEDGSYDATLNVRFGPARVALRARLTLQLDPTARKGIVTSKGKDSQGGVRFEAQMLFSVNKQQIKDRSRVNISSEVSLSGRLAHVIESGAGIVAQRMASEFSEQLSSVVAIQGSAAVSGVESGFSPSPGASIQPPQGPSLGRRAQAAFSRLFKGNPVNKDYKP